MTHFHTHTHDEIRNYVVYEVSPARKRVPYASIGYVNIIASASDIHYHRYYGERRNKTS